MSNDPDILLVLRPLPDDLPVAVRLRAALKTLLRRDKLRCLKVTDVPCKDQEEGSTQGVLE